VTTTDIPALADDTAIRAAVADWYRALDRHDLLADVLPYLCDDGLEMVFPEATKYGHTGFAEWYDAVTHRFFDEEHTVTSVAVDRSGPAAATLAVVVNWQARVWDAPAARSTWLGFDAYQTWDVVAGPGGRPLVRRYVVDALEPMPGSASL
jgi:ketosteroid isomerase-like protein